jgi:hypothetical protein
VSTGLQNEKFGSLRQPQTNKGDLKKVAKASGTKHFQLIKYPPHCCGKRETRLCTYEQTSSDPMVPPLYSLVLLWFKGIVCVCVWGGEIMNKSFLLLGSSDRDTRGERHAWTEALSSLRMCSVDRSRSVCPYCHINVLIFNQIYMNVSSSTVLLQKLTVAQLVKKFCSTFMEPVGSFRINEISDFVHRPDSKGLEDKNTTFRKLDHWSSD